MKIITFDEGQNSDEWHAWRKGGLGASDIGVIMGSNSYSTPLQLWEKKCGFRAEDPINQAMAHGISNEDVARQWINEHHQLNLKPVCVEDGEKSYFRASLDGWDFDSKTLVEIKCPISERILDAARLTQAIPAYWYDQMQWQIMLSNPARSFLAIWDYRHNSCLTIEMCSSTCKIEEMRIKGETFWRNVQMGKAPPPQKGDYIEIEDAQLHEFLLEYQNISEKENACKARKKELKNKIGEFGDDGNFMAYGFKVVRMTPRISYDMDKMRKDGIKVDEYIKKPDSIERIGFILQLRNKIYHLIIYSATFWR